MSPAPLVFTAFTFGDPTPVPAQIALVAAGVLIPVLGLDITAPSSGGGGSWTFVA